ncbi:MAG: hypothetical protein ABI835_15940 [Chloroflexota bacterium]
MLRLLALLLVTLLVGCASAAPPPTEAPPDPRQLIQEAADKIRSADTFRIDVTEAGPDYQIFTNYATVFFRRAVAQYVAPGIMQGTIRVIGAGLPLQIDIFARGAEQWYRAIWTGNLWLNQAFADGFNPMTLIAQETGFQAALNALINLSYIGVTELESGAQVFQLAATANGPDVSALLGGLISPVGIVDVGAFIDRETHYPSRFVITEHDNPYVAPPEPGEPKNPVVWTIDLYDINAVAELSTPEVMATASTETAPQATIEATANTTADATEAASP